MSEHLNSLGQAKSFIDRKSDRLTQHRNEGRSEQGSSPQAHKEDRVSLKETTETESTYGPIPGVEIGTPFQMLRKLVLQTLQDQGVALQVDSGGEGIIDLTKITPEEAQELIAEDGYFGVEQTSQRIVDFAINAFGNNPEKLQEMKSAIETGFQQAAEVFGGQLPEISHQTYEAVMEKLDVFAEQPEG